MKILIQKNEIRVFFVAFVVLFLETSLFHILMFTHNYLEANLLISYALLGLGLGSLVTFFINKRSTINFTYLILLFIAAIVFSFINITQFPKQIFFSPFLVLPFALGNIIITFFFRKGDPNRIYFFDLAGATFGIFFSVISIPLLKTENAILLCLIILSLIGLLSPEKKIKKSIVSLFTIILSISFALMLSNFKLHFLELEKITKCYDTTWPEKVFCSLKRPQNTFFLSEDNLVARISVFNQPESNKYLAHDGTPAESIKLVCYDGYNNDIVRKADLFTYRNDPRIPFMFFKENKQKTLFSQPPKVLIIGTSAEGIVKSIKFLVKDYSLIDSVEINPSIVKIMQNELFYLSGKAYENMNVEVIDARTYLQNSSTQYELITLLNTYKVEDIGYFGEPDFIHTQDAIYEYFDHLNEDGFILIEERDTHQRAHLAIFRLLENFIYVLKSRGYMNPEKHFFIYNFNIDKNKFRANWYTMIVVKKTPLTDSDISYFQSWFHFRHQLEYNTEDKQYYGMDLSYQFHTQIEYLPGSNVNTEYTKFIKSKDKGDFFGKEIILTPTSDNKPYTFDVYRERKELKKLISNIGIICAILFFIILSILFINLKKKSYILSIPLFTFFAFLGSGYFIIEITLMNFYQIYTGSPTNSFIFILGGLLISSGIGSFFSRNFSIKKIYFSLLGIIVFSFIHIFIRKYMIGYIHINVMLRNILITCTIFPLGFCMGIPFPFGIKHIKKSITEKYVSIFIAINSLASTFGIILGLYLSIVYGFILTLLFATGFYAIALASLSIFFNTRIHAGLDIA